MGRTAVKDKLHNVKVRRGWEADLLNIAQIKGPRLHEIMNNLLFSKKKAEEADLVYRHLFLECGNNEKAAFTILFACATAIDTDEKVFPFSPAQAKSAIETGKPEEVIEWYRPLFDVMPDFVVWDLNRYAIPAGLSGRTCGEKQYINEAEKEIKRLNYENILNKDVEAYKSDNNIAKTLADANNRFIKKWENIIILSKETIESNEKKLEIAKKELSKYQ